MCSMRWDQLRVENEEGRRLPGYRDEAIVRTFDAPEAMDVRFYEIHAKSALNRVPKQSRMPFPWTINPYRGCSHACAYCQVGDTPVLMGDGRTRPIEDLRPGDHIFGTVQVGQYRRYLRTRVLDHWSTVKSAYRVTLEDGTEFVTSGDHRFLSNRGWKHVVGAEQGPLQRPHLTTNNSLVGTGRFETGPKDKPDYRRGYLCGLVRGDGNLAVYDYTTPRRQRLYRFRLALTDFEALRRAQLYLDDLGIATSEFEFAVAAGDHRAVRAIRTRARDRVEAIQRLVEWPLVVTDEWCKGFLAGIFDAEGSYSQCLRISNTDPEILGWTERCMRRCGFAYRFEDWKLPNQCRTIRLLGGLPEVLRFFLATDPAISRRRDISGHMVKTFANLKVASIEPLGMEMPMYDITTGTGDFIANGAVSHNCFARPTHRYLDFDAGRDFEREIVVKVNVPELLRAELAKPSWRREHVALGTNTDPYQWVEGRYKLMPGIWEAFRDFANPCSVLTKSPLVLRDKDLLRQVAERAPVTASFSVPTLEEKTWRATEPHTPHPRARLEAVAELNRIGIPAGILIAPLMPGINDSPAQVEEIVKIAAEAGAVSVGGIALHLRGEVRDIFMDWLNAHRPDLVPWYEELYARTAYAPREVQERARKLARLPGAPMRSRRFLAGRDGDAAERDPGTGATRRFGREETGHPLPQAEQPSLF
jgi:DNA repair photolyase